MTEITSTLPVRHLRRALLDWYDQHGRDLPWRLSPAQRARGRRPDPYAVWLAEVMLQQTTVPHAAPYYLRFLERWPTVADLAAAPRDDVLAAWAGLGYYARARKLHACAVELAARGGVFPRAENDLLALPGIGPYTAAAIRAIAFDEPANVVDGNVERVIARLYAVATPLPKAKGEIRRRAGELAGGLSDESSSIDRPGDYAQALMDLGAVVCTPRAPDCPACPWSRWCAARAEGRPATYPHKTPRKQKPVRRGVAFVVVRNEEIWMRRRPDDGLLGGMLEVPSTPWREDTWAAPAVRKHAPLPGRWRRCGQVQHVFTHFRLELKVWCTDAPVDWTPPQGTWHRIADLTDRALPSVMRKVVAAALADRDHGGGRKK